MPSINRKSPTRPWQKERKPFGTVSKENTKFYKSKAWEQLRNAFRTENPLCKNVDQCGGATHTVDHIIPIREGGAALDWYNLQPLCESCNASKTGGQSWKKKQKE
jgi:5-methylcytosine-specific restriction protein A